MNECKPPPPLPLLLVGSPSPPPKMSPGVGRNCILISDRFSFSALPAWTRCAGWDDMFSQI